MNAARPERKRPRGYRVSGFPAMKVALSRRGLSALDGRSAAARAVSRWRSATLSDLGDDLSTAQTTLLEIAAQDVALLAVADGWLRANAEAVINRRKKAGRPSHLSPRSGSLVSSERPRTASS